MSSERKGMEGSTAAGGLEVAGGRLAYETKGRGPPLLFIHAVIADRRMWGRELDLYSHHHQTVSFDLRGFGGSSAASKPFSYVQDVRSLISHLRLERPYVVGASMGGAVAIGLALESPELVSGLCLLAPGLSGG